MAYYYSLFSSLVINSHWTKIKKCSSSCDLIGILLLQKHILYRMKSKTFRRRRLLTCNEIVIKRITHTYFIYYALSYNNIISNNNRVPITKEYQTVLCNSITVGLCRIHRKITTKEGTTYFFID